MQKFARNTMLTLAATATLMGVPVVAPPQVCGLAVARSPAAAYFIDPCVLNLERCSLSRVVVPGKVLQACRSTVLQTHIVAES